MVEEERILRVVGQFLRDNMGKHPVVNYDVPQPVARVELPPTIIENKVEVPEVNNHVDTAPIAKVLEQMTALFKSALEAQNKIIANQQKALDESSKLVANLIKRLEQAPVFEFNPTFAPTVQPSEVLVQHHEAPVANKRRFTIKHSDGTSSTLTQE